MGCFCNLSHILYHIKCQMAGGERVREEARCVNLRQDYLDLYGLYEISKL